MPVCNRQAIVINVRTHVQNSVKLPCFRILFCEYLVVEKEAWSFPFFKLKPKLCSCRKVKSSLEHKRSGTQCWGKRNDQVCLIKSDRTTPNPPPSEDAQITERVQPISSNRTTTTTDRQLSRRDRKKTVRGKRVKGKGFSNSRYENGPWPEPVSHMLQNGCLMPFMSAGIITDFERTTIGALFFHLDVTTTHQVVRATSATKRQDETSKCDCIQEAPPDTKKTWRWWNKIHRVHSSQFSPTGKILPTVGFTTQESKSLTFMRVLCSSVGRVFFTTVNPAAWIPRFNSDLKRKEAPCFVKFKEK